VGARICPNSSFRRGDSEAWTGWLWEPFRLLVQPFQGRRALSVVSSFPRVALAPMGRRSPWAMLSNPIRGKNPRSTVLVSYCYSAGFCSNPFTCKELATTGRLPMSRKGSCGGCCAGYADVSQIAPQSRSPCSSSCSSCRSGVKVAQWHRDDVWSTTRVAAAGRSDSASGGVPAWTAGSVASG
jgi:hypothetical protein